MEPIDSEGSIAENLNSVFRHWGPTLVVVGIALTLWQYLGHENLIDDTLRTTFCYNHRVATLFTKSEGQTWNWNTRYRTDEYFSNWGSMINNEYAKDVSARQSLIATIHNMEAANRILGRLEYQEPFVGIDGGQRAVDQLKNQVFKDLTDISKTIASNLEMVGFSERSCSDVILQTP